MDLELGDLVDYGRNGTWLRVPLGKLNDERSVPVDDVALEALEEWLAHRTAQRGRPHPRDSHLADFVFVERGRRLGPTRIQRGLRDAITAAGLTGPDGQPAARRRSPAGPSVPRRPALPIWDAEHLRK